MKYNIYVQGNLVDTIEAPNTGTAIASATQKMQTGEIQYDKSQPQNLKVEPVSEQVYLINNINIPSGDSQ